MSKLNQKDYWETRLRKYFGPHGVGDIRFGKYYNNWLYNIRKHVFNRRMKSTGINFRRVDILDVGSGTGFYIDRWKDLNVKTIIGTDITNIAVENLKRKYQSDDFYQVDIGADIKNIDNQKFDIVSAFDVLYHIVDDEQYKKAISNIYSLLKPNGLFVFSENFLHRGTKRATHHFVSRSLNDIKKILSDIGFKPVERVPMFVLMNMPIDSRSRFLKTLFRVIENVVLRNKFLGFLLGIILYPLELISVSLMKEGPSTEMMICKKLN